MQQVDFNEIPSEGDRWQAFARDFLVEIGFHIESISPPIVEGNQDFCAVEQIQGKFNFHPFRWMVSPKHKASTRTAVKESEEPDIEERLLRAKADGFLGFYSTPASPALLHALSELRVKGFLRDYKIFDTKIIDSYLHTVGFARLLARYFPNVAAQSRPLHLVEDEYLPLKCDHCGKDLLEALYREDHKSIVARVAQRPASSDEPTLIHDLYYACMGTCDETLQNVYLKGRLHSASSVVPLADLVAPPLYLMRVLNLIDRLDSPQYGYTEGALEKEKYLFRALAQRVMVDPTDDEIAHAKKLMFSPADD